MKRLPTIALALATALALGACGDATDGVAPDAGAAASDAPAEATRDAEAAVEGDLHLRLLGHPDVPEGWSFAAATPDDESSEAVGDALAQCVEDAELPGDEADGQEVGYDLASPEDDAFVFVTAFPADEDVDAGFEAIAQLGDCGTVSFTDDVGVEFTLDLTPLELDLPGADRHEGATFTGEIAVGETTLPVTLELLAMQFGDHVVLLVSGILFEGPEDTPTTQELASAIAGRMTGELPPLDESDVTPTDAS